MLFPLVPPSPWWEMMRVNIQYTYVVSPLFFFLLKNHLPIYHLPLANFPNSLEFDRTIIKYTSLFYAEDKDVTERGRLGDSFTITC